MVLLYIDDDAEDVEFFCDAVESIDPGCEPITAPNGIVALNLLRKITPDLIFLDVNMPGMNGRDTLRAIRSDERLATVPVYILSTSSDKKEHEYLTNAGATQCLVKPCTFAELCALLRSLLINHS